MIATCPDQKLLRQYANGMVSEDQADELTLHLRDCDSCQSWLAMAEDLDDTLVSRLRQDTVDDSFESEPECQSAMAIALGALAAVNREPMDYEIDLPSSIGDYDIVRRIGRGGMGNVYLAQHTKLDRSVAVKVLASHRLSDPRMHDRFQNEMRAIGSLSHPNIVTAHDARDVDGVALLVTEWIDGLDLKQIVGRIGPLPVADVCEIGARVADALSYISSQNLVHRDLKPSNVMLNRDGEVKLLDLGLARLRTGDGEYNGPASTATGQAMGTADYVAPEQINDAREVDIQADIYSLGCTIYKLITGRAPFENDRHTSVFAKLTAHVSDPPLPLREVAPEVPADLGNLVDQMLSKLPEDRPSSIDGIASTFRRHSEGADLKRLVQTAMATAQEAIAPRPHAAASTANTQPFWRRRVPVTVAIAAGIIGLLIGCLAGVTITITHPDGSKTKIDTPKSSEVAVDQEGNVDIILPSGVDSTEPSNQVAANIDLSNLTPPDDSARFEGVWRKVVGMHRGSNAPLTSDGLAMVFHQGTIVMMQRSRPVMLANAKLDSDLNRLTLSVMDPRGVLAETQKAIYRFRDETRLQVCIPEPGSEDFPSSMEPIRMSNVSIITFVKVDYDSQPDLIPKLMQDPSSEGLLHAIAMHQRLKTNNVDADSLIESIHQSTSATESAESRNNLKQIAIAFHNYHDAHRAFPTSEGAATNRKLNAGEYPCSWRVAILPFIEQSKLYEQYNFQEPWDSEDNLKLLDQMPATFRRPGSKPGSTTTGYVGFVGENTVLGKKESTRIRDITDGTSNTVMLVEAKTDIPWTKPEDFSLDQIADSGLLDQESPLVSLADGSVLHLKRLTAEILQQAATINDGKYLQHLNR